MLVACKSRETVLNKAIYQKKQLQNPANPGFLTSPPQAPKIFGGFFPPYFGPWGGKTLFSPHFPDPGGKIEKAVSPHNGGKKDFRWLFFPHYAGPWGEKQLLFSPHFRDPGGKIESFSPPYGGKKVRRRRKILRIWRSKMLNSLNKNVF